MYRPNERQAKRYPRAEACSLASEWGRTFLTQTAIGILLALLWATLGLQ